MSWRCSQDTNAGGAECGMGELAEKGSAMYRTQRSEVRYSKSHSLKVTGKYAW